MPYCPYCLFKKENRYDLKKESFLYEKKAVRHRVLKYISMRI